MQTIGQERGNVLLCSFLIFFSNWICIPRALVYTFQAMIGTWHRACVTHMTHMTKETCGSSPKQWKMLPVLEELDVTKMRQHLLHTTVPYTTLRDMPQHICCRSWLRDHAIICSARARADHVIYKCPYMATFFPLFLITSSGSICGMELLIHLRLTHACIFTQQLEGYKCYSI